MPNTQAFVHGEVELQNLDEDALDWVDQAKRLALLLAHPLRPTPLTIGIQGDWGSGKTTFLSFVLRNLGVKATPLAAREDSLASRLEKYSFPLVTHVPRMRRYPNVLVHLIRFDSWVFTQSEPGADYLFPIYIAQVLQDYLEETQRLPKAEVGKGLAARMAQVLQPFSGGGAAVAAAGGAAAALIPPPFGLLLAAVTAFAGHRADNQHHRDDGQGDNAPLQDHLSAELVNFKGRFESMVKVLLAPTSDQQQHLPNPAPDPYNRLFILVDDLDRVPPLTAVNITEKIKLFMDVPGCVFILASDLQVIREGLRAKLGNTITEEEGKNYLDKIVKINYHIPYVPRTKTVGIAQYYPRYANTFEDKHLLAQADGLLCVFPVVAGNPRNLKRVLNNYVFTMDLHYGPDGDANPHVAMRALAVTVLHQYNTEAARIFSRWLARQPNQSIVLQDALDLPPGPSVPQTHTLHEALRDGAQHLDVGLEDFVHSIQQLDYSVAEWQSAFTLSTLSPVAEAGRAAMSRHTGGELSRD